ncbi:MAG: metal ABC transporter permease [Verrucomicrobiota bacterium]
MSLLREILSPDFLLRNSVYVSLLIGFACPVIGVFLVLRRMIFLGVALPQISSTGVALALSLHVWYGHYDGAHGSGEKMLAFIGSIVFSVVAILWLAFLERRGRGMTEGRIGTAYVLALAASILLLAKCAQAERGWLELFKGQIIAIAKSDLHLALVTFALVLLVLLVFRKEFLLVSFDPEMALTLRKNVLFWDVLLYLLIGVTISVAVLTAGPLITFGFMLIPPLIAHLFAQNMRQFAIAASGIGGAAAFAGFCLAYQYDLPIGPTDVVLLGVVYALAFGVRKLLNLRAAKAELKTA